MSTGTGPWLDLGIPRVINAAGKMTYLGSSSLQPAVIDAMAAAAGQYVDIAALKQAIGTRIAQLTGAPAACVVSCAAAGIAQAMAATITGTELSLIEQLPDPPVDRREVILCQGHAVHFGAPLTVMLRLGGGIVRVVGAPDATLTDLESAVGQRTAALCFVVSHHTCAAAPTLTQFVEIGRRYAVPVIVDAAAEIDLHSYLDQGADLVVYSGHKAIGGPTSGIVLGNPDLIAACRAQEAGIGRAMKVGKETLAGILVAVQQYLTDTATRTPQQLAETVRHLKTSLGDELPAAVTVVQDPTRPIPRLRVAPSPLSPFDAADLVSALESHSPSVRTRNHGVAAGHIDIDPRELSGADVQELAQVLRQLLTGRAT